MKSSKLLCILSALATALLVLSARGFLDAVDSVGKVSWLLRI